MLVSVDSFSSLIVATGDARITHPQTPTKAQGGKDWVEHGALNTPRAPGVVAALRATGPQLAGVSAFGTYAKACV